MNREELKSKMAELAALLLDTSRPDWFDLATQRNNLSINLKALKHRRTPTNTGGIDSVSVRAWL